MVAQDETRAFFVWLKRESERLWGNVILNRNIYGFQTQQGTKWLPGLNQAEIDAFENAVGFRFPQIYRDFLTCMNGTDREMINIFGESAHPSTYSIGYYSYPRDLSQIKDRIAWIYDAFEITEHDVEAQAIPHILPVVSHRFLITDNCDANPVLSIYGRDVIIYARDLRAFLADDILHSHARDPSIPSTLTVKYWLEG